jgi:hypothetical protein
MNDPRVYRRADYYKNLIQRFYSIGALYVVANNIGNLVLTFARLGIMLNAVSQRSRRITE